jgi:hypothetical protein
MRYLRAQMDQPNTRADYWEDEDRVHYVNGDYRAYYNLGYGCRWLRSGYHSD